MIAARPRPRTSPGCASWWRGSSLRSESSRRAGQDRRGRTASAARCEAACVGSSRGLRVERQVQLQNVHAGLAEEAEAAPVGVSSIRSSTRSQRQPANGGDPARLDARRWPARCAGRRRRPRSVTASTGTSARGQARVVGALAPQVGARGCAREACRHSSRAVGAEVVEAGGGGVVSGDRGAAAGSSEASREKLLRRSGFEPTTSSRRRSIAAAVGLAGEEQPGRRRSSPAGSARPSTSVRTRTASGRAE